MNSCPFTQTALRVANVEGRTQLRFIGSKQRTIQKTIRNRKGGGVFAGQIEAGKVAVHTSAHLNASVVLIGMDNHIIDLRFDFQAGTG